MIKEMMMPIMTPLAAIADLVEETSKRLDKRE